MKRTLDEMLERTEHLMRIHAYGTALKNLDMLAPGWLMRRRARQYLRLDRLYLDLVAARTGAFNRFTGAA